MPDMLLMEALEKMDKTIESYQRELNTVRTGRANPNLLDSINDFFLIPHYAILAKNYWIALESDTNEVASVKFIEWIISSNEEMAIPKVIYDIKKEDIQSMATYAYKEAHPLYSVPRLFDKKDIENIYLEVCR